MSELPPGSFVHGDEQPGPSTADTTAAPAVVSPTIDPQSLSPQEAREAEEEREEAQSLSEAALSIPDSEAADDDAASLYQPANEAVPGDAGVVVQQGPSVDWQGVLGHSASGFGAANAATSAYFNFARTATAFGLNFAKRLTQGLVAVPAILADGAFTGTAPGDTSGTPSISRAAHSGIATFFDAISLVAVGGIDLTSAVTSAGLGAAGSGVEGIRRALGSEVLRSLMEFSKLVKREWNHQDDSLPPGGIPAYSIIGITKALSTWVCIQLVTRNFQEQRMLPALDEIDTNRLKEEVEKLKQIHNVGARTAPFTPITDGASKEGEHAQNQADVRITSNQALAGEYSGNVIGAEIGHKNGSSARLPGSELSDEPARPLSDAEAVHNLQRYSKLVLGVYGGIALLWLNSMPADSKTMPSNMTTTSSKSKTTAAPTGNVVFSAEDEFMRKDQAEFLEAAAQMELEDEDDDRLASVAEAEDAAATGSSTEGVVAVDRNGNGHRSSYNLWDVISGTHDEDLFHHTADLKRGAVAAGQYEEDSNAASGRTPYNPKDKARPSKPRFYVVTDHPRKTIILVLRGTLSMGDLAADLTCESVPFVFDPEVQKNMDARVAQMQAAEGGAKRASFVSEEAFGFLVHEGFVITANEIGYKGRAVHRAVAAALAANPGYSIDVTGHSLGAGVASVLAMMWADPTTGLTIASSGLPAGRRLHAYCFAVPCVTSSQLGRSVSSIITSYTYSYDLVCRLSLGSIQDIRNCCAWLCYQDKEAHHGDGTMNALMKRAFEYQSGRMEASKRAELEHDFLVLRKTLEANMHNTHLYPPGKVLYALTRGRDILEPEGGDERGTVTGSKQRLFRVKDESSALRAVFGQMLMSRNMLSSHMPTETHGSLHNLTV